MNNNIETNENGTDFTVETMEQAKERLTALEYNILQGDAVYIEQTSYSSDCVPAPELTWSNSSDDRVEELEDTIDGLEKMVDVSCSDGNWNYDPYLHGMANGMIFALAMMKNEEPVYLDAPEVWLKDLPYKQRLSVQEEATPTECGDGCPGCDGCLSGGADSVIDLPTTTARLDEWAKEFVEEVDKKILEDAQKKNYSRSMQGM
jgi:hypothetical protein